MAVLTSRRLVRDAVHCGKMIHPTAEVSEQGTRKCCPTNTILQPSVPSTDHELSNSGVLEPQMLAPYGK